MILSRSDGCVEHRKTTPATRYKADAVVLVNTDITQSFLVRHATLQGVALKCHP